MNKKNRCCENCENCISIGEGDFICGECGNKMILAEYMPTEEYYKCNGKKWSE